MRITSKGQLTIPLEFRNHFGVVPHAEVGFVADKAGLRIVKSQKPSGKGQRLLDRMRGRGGGKLSTAEIMKLTRS